MADDKTTQDWKFEDARMPTDQERQVLCKMLFDVLLEIRSLSWEGKADQAADLADAFHNLPVYLWSDEFSFSFFRKFLEAYQEKYSGNLSFDYLNMLDKIVS